jgi:hypothetical protein
MTTLLNEQQMKLRRLTAYSARKRQAPELAINTETRSQAPETVKVLSKTTKINTK